MITLDNYHNRFDPADEFDQWLFRAGGVPQSAEFNEVQSASQERLRGVTDVLLRDGSILSGAELILTVADGVCSAYAENGAIYIDGAVRGVAPATFTIPASGRVSVGVYLTETIITELEDPRLINPAISALNAHEYGAARLKKTLQWGYLGDGRSGKYYSVHDVENGVVLSKAPPPQIDAIAQYLERYDRQSAGGYYVSRGLKVSRLADAEGKQVYSMEAGVARVGGREIIRQFARRFELDPLPDLRTISFEAHAVGAGHVQGADFDVVLNYAPLQSVATASAAREVTHNVVSGAAGSLDLLPFAPVVEIVSVVQGGTTFVQGTDYQLTGDQVDWSIGGDDPGAYGTYTVTYKFTHTMSAANLLAVTETGFTVPGTVTLNLPSSGTADAELVPDTTTFTVYAWAMPRIDRVCLDSAGEIHIVRGVAAARYPRTPHEPSSMLSVAILEQKWGSGSRVVNTGTRLVDMRELTGMQRNIESLFALVAEERLALNITQRDNAVKKGVFADPFLDDDLRDQGIAQTAAVFRGILTLGVNSTVHDASLDGDVTLDPPGAIVGDTFVLIDQPLRTSAMRVNPYDAFAPLPGVALLQPAADFWIEFQTNWLSPVTRQFDETVWLGGRQGPRFVVASDASETQSDVEKVGTRYVDLQFLREIDVFFDITGFGAGEILNEVRFDGVSVPFEEVAP